MHGCIPASGGALVGGYAIRYMCDYQYYIIMAHMEKKKKKKKIRRNKNYVTYRKMIILI